MANQTRVQMNRDRRATRTRSHINGTAERPRLSVFISNTHITAQAIDDDNSVTVATASTVGHKTTGSMTDKAVAIGESIADTCIKLGIESVVFDRGAKKYHGRVKALAEAARKKGLKF